ncbi:MAG: hypothetical protein ACK2U3_13390 [Anaerolineales bacterium]|jgi:SAM-dependent methyltransferase
MSSPAMAAAQNKSPNNVLEISLFLLSGSLLIFEITLTRLFSVAQFYHFAFMVVSIALLGFGASGTTIAIFPSLLKKDEYLTTSILALIAAISFIASYLISNWIPFDSFSIAWDRTQVLILCIHYVMLASPFYFGGMLVGFLLSKYPDSINRTYAYNLTGSAAGCLAALFLPSLVDGVGTVVASFMLGIIASLVPVWRILRNQKKLLSSALVIFLATSAIVLIILSIVDLNFRYNKKPSYKWLDLQISPYKNLSYALQYPGARIISSRWNSYSRIDLIMSEGIRSLPGLSYQYMGTLPRQDGLFIDGDDLNPVIKTMTKNEIYAYLPTAIVYNLRQSAEVLLLEPRGGLEILTALNHNPKNITVVEENPLIIQAASHIYNNKALNYILGSGRNFLKRSMNDFDIIVLAMVSNYHPVRSGAYSLAEDYRYTVESIQESLKRLKPDGILIFTRWLQNPPSEFLRAFSTSLQALEGLNIEPQDKIIAFRGFNTGTLLVKKTGFSANEQLSVRQFLKTRSFDLVYAPDMKISDANKYNILPEPLYYLTFQDITPKNSRSDFYRNYSYDVSPPTDNKPFFGQYFKWDQTSQIIAEYGKSWQPFGGAGFFVILILLFIAGFIGSILIIAPVLIAQIKNIKYRNSESVQYRIENYQKRPFILYLLYFGFLGFAYLMVEIPLIQKFILVLGHPATSLTTILFTLLFFSGVGSIFSPKLNSNHVFILLLITLLLLPFLLPVIIDLLLALPLIIRITITIAVLAPVGFMMGVPFPKGIKKVTSQESNPILVPWIWAVNGSTSVISSILAALIALSFGFNLVFVIGGFLYLGSFLVALKIFTLHPVQSLPR